MVGISGKRASSVFTKYDIDTEGGQFIVLFLAVVEHKFRIELNGERLKLKFERLDNPEIFQIQVVHMERILETWVFTTTEIKKIANILSLASIN